jgi:predicted nucleotidyltransferase
MKRPENKYPTIIEGIVFGSRARGTHPQWSEADITVVT